jgi:uncharacterized protein (TIRG00374 family)
MTARQIALRAAVGVAVSGASVYLVTRAISVDEAIGILARARWEPIALTAFLLTIDVAIRALRWRALLGPIAVLPRGTVLGHLLVGYLANSALPARLGELVRAFSLADREGMSRSAVVGTVVVERLIDLGVLAIAVFAGIAFVTSASVFLLGAVTGLVVGFGGLTVLLFMGRAGADSRWLDHVPAGRVRSTVHGLINGLSVIRSATVLTQSIILSAVAWAVTGLAFAVAGTAVGVTLTFPEALLFAAAVNLATAIPAGPGYIGTFELAAISVSAAVGIVPLAGLAMGVIVHGSTLILTSLGGLVSFAALHLVTERAPDAVPRKDEQVLAVAQGREEDRGTAH